MSRLSLLFALLTFFAAFPPPASAFAEVGTTVQQAELATLAGGKEKIISPRARANVFVFFRPNHERSLDALKQLAACERELAGKPIWWVAVVSSAEAPEDVRAMVAEAGIRMPVLIDPDDALYAKLGITMHPTVAIVDAKAKVAAMEAYRQVDYCDIIKTHVRVLLGEVTQAQLDAALNPEATELPGADLMKKAMRDVNMARKLIEIAEYAEAVKFAQRAITVAPVPDGFAVLGAAYAKQGNCAEAQKAFAQAAKLNSGDKVAMASRGSCP
jgi:tetratricopeptide (TPR) repeat protein